jgi:phage terminase large subunit-like protein
MSAPKRPHVEKSLSYAKRVAAGKILACKWVKLACRRHLKDLRQARGKRFPFKFDAAKAETACRFAELLPHVKGQWAQPQVGKPNRIKLEPWQCFHRSMLFGWVEKATGFRRFRVSYLEVPRKNGKSVGAAIDGLYFFAADGEYGAEAYSGAVTEKQAWEVFRPAKQMAERTPEFLEQFGVQVNAKSLTILKTGARFEPIIGKPGDGASPSLSITDEYHEHPDSAQFDTMVTGMGARQQPLADVITTAGEDIGGPCYALRERVQKMLEGAKDERLFGIIYTIDEGDDWTSEVALRKANPNFDVSVSGSYLREQQRAAINDARLQNVFKTKHLDVWCSARSPFMNMEWWHRCEDPTLTPEQFVGEPAAFGADLASRLDLTSVVRVFRREIEGEPHYYAFGRHYVPRAAVDDPKNRHYQGWAHSGHLTATEGNDTDYDVLAKDVLEDGKLHSLALFLADPWNCRAVTDILKREGIDEKAVLEVPQQVQHLSAPMKDLEAAVCAGRFHHTGDPVLTYAVSNVTVRPDANENIFPRKDRPENKIDPAVALVLAFKGAQLLESVAPFLGISFG